MAKTATIYFSANISGDGLSENVVPPTAPQLTNSPASHATQAISSGPNTIQIPQLPSPAQYLDIVPPSNSAVNKWLMASGDTTGVQISSTLQTRIALSTAITSFVLRASGSENVDLFWY